MGDKIRAAPRVKESLFCALMYEDTYQKKKRKQIQGVIKAHVGRVTWMGMGNKRLLIKAWKIRGNYFFPRQTLLL